MKNIDKIQNILPLGYLFLVLLGIAKESIYYYQIGINIIKYSSIMDILISPIAAITSHPVFAIVIIILFTFFCNLPQLLFKYESSVWLHKNIGTDNKNPDFIQLPENERKEHYLTVSIKFFAFFLLSIFLGYGLADGNILSEKIKNNQLNYNYKLNYADETTENVFIIGSNTAYFFYVTKNSPIIKIAPTASIKNIELTKNRMLSK